MFLGKEYWTWFFTRQLIDYYSILKRGLSALSEFEHEHLVVCPEKDSRISLPSLALYKKAIRGKENSIIIKDGTHCLFYDKNPVAEESAVKAVLAFAKR